MVKTIIPLTNYKRHILKLGVALTGCNTTGPPSRAAPGKLRCICAGVTDDDRLQMTTTDASDCY